MVKYHSTRGSCPPVSFEQAVLQGFAADGGLFVPHPITRLSRDRLNHWKHLCYVDLAKEVMSCFIDSTIVPKQDLGCLLDESFASFDKADPPLLSIDSDGQSWVLELFHGPTLSFKDVAMGFLIRVMDYFLDRRNDQLSLILATTGDTGPAAAYAAAGRKRISCWPLFPAGMISKEQELQMTTIGAENVTPVGVRGCLEGGDDLDLVVARLFGDGRLTNRLKLSSVNSINIGRVLMQAVHYFYAYFRLIERFGDALIFSIPAGAFGNSCGGEIARAMGLPIQFICATNKNHTLHRIFSAGIFEKLPLQHSLSSAIDIVVPYNFWRFLYLRSDLDPEVVNRSMSELKDRGKVTFDVSLYHKLSRGVVSTSVTDEQTLVTMRDLYEQTGYLLDPHGAVAVAGAAQCRSMMAKPTPCVSVATAHPAKFPEVIKKALGSNHQLPEAAFHPSLEEAKHADVKMMTCNYEELEKRLVEEIEASLQGQHSDE
ncbi:MAG: threonine synthase [Desulfofustis sp.]|nr:threonine synthase [Desulfofustis sp.]